MADELMNPDLNDCPSIEVELSSRNENPEQDNVAPNNISMSLHSNECDSSVFTEMSSLIEPEFTLPSHNSNKSFGDVDPTEDKDPDNESSVVSCLSSEGELCPVVTIYNIIDTHTVIESVTLKVEPLEYSNDKDVQLIGDVPNIVHVLNTSSYRIKEEPLSEEESEVETETLSSSCSSLSELDDSIPRIEEIEHMKTTNKKRPKKMYEELDENDLPQIADLQISVSKEEATLIGNVFNIVKNQVVVQALENLPPIDLDSILFLDQGQKAMGKVFDVFGSIYKPLYVVRFNSNDHVLEKGIKEGDPVFYAPSTEHTTIIVMNELLQQQFSDASWDCDAECPEMHLDYSDDEAERNAKNRLKAATQRKKQLLEARDECVEVMDERDGNVNIRKKLKPMNPFNRKEHSDFNSSKIFNLDKNHPRPGVSNTRFAHPEPFQSRNCKDQPWDGNHNAHRYRSRALQSHQFGASPQFNSFSHEQRSNISSPLPTEYFKFKSQLGNRNPNTGNTFGIPSAQNSIPDRQPSQNNCHTPHYVSAEQNARNPVFSPENLQWRPPISNCINSDRSLILNGNSAFNNDSSNMYRLPPSIHNLHTRFRHPPPVPTQPSTSFPVRSSFSPTLINRHNLWNESPPNSSIFTGPPPVIHNVVGTQPPFDIVRPSFNDLKNNSASDISPPNVPKFNCYDYHRTKTPMPQQPQSNSISSFSVPPSVNLYSQPHVANPGMQALNFQPYRTSSNDHHTGLQVNRINRQPFNNR